MTIAKLIEGRPLAARYLELAARQIAQTKKTGGGCLSLATVQVGHAKDAVLYSDHLGRLLKKMGIAWRPNVFPENESERTVIQKIRELNNDAEITGILVFSPLPAHFNAVKILNNLHVLKDVEGRLFLKSHFGVVSPTANAVLTLIESKTRTLAGQEAVVVGHSDLVGKPTAVLLTDKMATVTVCHAKTRNLEAHVSKADILVAAVGKPEVIKGRWIKKGAIVIDVGENVVNGRLVGDVEFETAKKHASYISPVPGGVGPVTNVMLIKNLLALQKMKDSLNGVG